MSLIPASSIETRSPPVFARCFPRSFTFYVAHPVRSIREQVIRRSLSGFRLLVLRGLIFDPRFHSFLQQI
jgi:hypothetical protein